MNYDNEMEKILHSLKNKPKLLLHSCCAPCSSAVIERLRDFFDITVLYYNPNIEPKEEYEKRKQEQINFLSIISNDEIKLLDCDYDNDKYHEVIKGLENEPEKGKRCYVCYNLRLEYTCLKALENHFDYFGTTLTVSPFKLSSWINEIGIELEQKYGIKFLLSDFKKKNGYSRSLDLSRKYDLYRQDYCGCIYSKK